jgi:threonine dehydratase
MHPDWNISLFHYRNHGADYGKILIGIQVPNTELDRWQQFLKSIDYTYWEETHNPAYKLFLNH